MTSDLASYFGPGALAPLGGMRGYYEMLWNREPFSGGGGIGFAMRGGLIEYGLGRAHLLACCTGRERRQRPAGTGIWMAPSNPANVLPRRSLALSTEDPWRLLRDEDQGPRRDPASRPTNARDLAA